MARGSVNKVILIGTLGRDPEARKLPNGNLVVSISIATDEGYKDKNTQQQVDRTEWHSVEAFGRLAEVMDEYLKKGAKVYVEGKLRTDEYEKDGIKRYKTKIIANEMTMLDSRDSSSPAPAPAPAAQAPQPKLGYQFENGVPIQPHDVQRYQKAGIGPWPQGQVPPFIPAGY